MGSLEVMCMPTSFTLPCHRSILNYGNVSDYTAAVPMSGGWIKPRSLGDLPTELLISIFKQLRVADRVSLANARLVSRELDSVITPIFFEDIALNEAITSQTTIPGGTRMLRNIFQHSRNITIRSDLDLERVQFILAKLDRCGSICWNYTPHDHRDCSRPTAVIITPSQLLSTPQLLERHPSLHLDVQGLNLRDLSRDDRQAEIEFLNHGIIDDNRGSLAPLRSLTLLASPSPLTTAPGPLLHLLLRCRDSLETLYYRDRGRGSSLDFSTLSQQSQLGGKQPNLLPAFKTLTLESYAWNHTPLEVSTHWDFSRLEKLRLLGMPLFPFLSSVGAALVRGRTGTEVGIEEALGRLGSQLHVLQCDDSSAHLLPDRRVEATELLGALVSGSECGESGRLEELRITCHTRLFSVLERLKRHANTLRVLRFRDHVGFQDEGVVCPMLRVGELEGLGRMTSAGLRELEVDMDIREEGKEEKEMFLGALCREFKRLDTLTLHVQTVLRPEEEDDERDVQMWEGGGHAIYGDPDREEAVAIFQKLLRGREEGEGEGTVPWRSITVNVGGWKRVLVRRMSQAWQDLGRQGINAERCFVLERGGGNVMTMREESAVER